MRSKGGRSGVPAAAYYSAREEGTGGAGTLGKESLRSPYVPPSHDWCVPLININIGKFHFRVTCQCGPAAVAKLQLPSCLVGQVGMMGAVTWQQLQSHTGWAKLLSPYKSVAQPVALQQISPITVSAADPPITVHHPLMFSATVPP